MPSLAEQASDFASDMSRLIQATINTDAEFGVVAGDFESDVFFVSHNPEDQDDDDGAIQRALGTHIQVDEAESLSVLVHWKFIPNTTGEFLKTDMSKFGLYVRGKHADHPRPVLRLEVDEKAPSDSWGAAHIQVSGESTNLGLVWGIRGVTGRNLQDLHLPVGGFYYRPSLEDFLEFAIMEDLLPKKPQRRETLDATRSTYRERQLRNLVRKNPGIARDELDQIDD